MFAPFANNVNNRQRGFDSKRVETGDSGCRMNCTLYSLIRMNEAKLSSCLIALCYYFVLNAWKGCKLNMMGNWLVPELVAIWYRYELYAASPFFNGASG